MLDGDTAVLDALCSDDLTYTHSKGDHDDKRSYLHKVGSRYFTYLEITLRPTASWSFTAPRSSPAG